MSSNVTFDTWTASRPLASIGTNAGSASLPFQNWKPFKEAFAPEVIQRVQRDSNIEVETLLDPFLGSGTSALAAQFLGIRPIGIEVNPYLRDLAAAKCESYVPESIIRDYEFVVSFESDDVTLTQLRSELPATFVPPGKGDRFIFPMDVANRVLTLNLAINALDDKRNATLLRALLGGILIDVSNIRVSGKGRRYRTNWHSSQKTQLDVARLYAQKFQLAMADIMRFGNRKCLEFLILNDDSRNISKITEANWDASIFSPPYPNSFDYTDVYNIELWMLGYLRDRVDNTQLRHRTLTSHVQVYRQFPVHPGGSSVLDNTMANLRGVRSQLWNRHIPEMVGSYFYDLLNVLEGVRGGLSKGGSVWLVVGNSQYADCLVDVPAIVSELAPSVGLRTREVEAFRSMRRSPQQGGRPELYESLVVLDSTEEAYKLSR